MIIYILGLCGIPWEEALHGIPASLGNQLLACHWMANGIEIESPNSEKTDDIKSRFEELSNRQKSWQLEL